MRDATAESANRREEGRPRMWNRVGVNRSVFGLYLTAQAMDSQQPRPQTPKNKTARGTMVGITQEIIMCSVFRILSRRSFSAAALPTTRAPTVQDEKRGKAEREQGRSKEETKHTYSNGSRKKQQAKTKIQAAGPRNPH